VTHEICVLLRILTCFRRLQQLWRSVRWFSWIFIYTSQISSSILRGGFRCFQSENPKKISRLAAKERRACGAENGHHKPPAGAPRVEGKKGTRPTGRRRAGERWLFRRGTALKGVFGISTGTARPSTKICTSFSSMDRPSTHRVKLGNDRNPFRPSKGRRPFLNAGEIGGFCGERRPFLRPTEFLRTVWAVWKRKIAGAEAATARASKFRGGARSVEESAGAAGALSSAPWRRGWSLMQPQNDRPT
jgi:hypothetical protein